MIINFFLFLFFFRGQDWSGGDIDGGEGGVGTIVERIKPSASTSQERSIVIVLWDSTGQQSQCVTGHMNSFALRVIDNALVGIRHEGKKCKFCNDDDNSSMTTLLTHTVAHSTKPSFMPKTNNQSIEKFLSLALS